MRSILLWLAFVPCFAHPVVAAVASVRLNDGRVLQQVEVVSVGKSTFVARWKGGQGTIALNSLPEASRRALLEDYRSRADPGKRPPTFEEFAAANPIRNPDANRTNGAISLQRSAPLSGSEALDILGIPHWKLTFVPNRPGKSASVSLVYGARDPAGQLTEKRIAGGIGAMHLPTIERLEVTVAVVQPEKRISLSYAGVTTDLDLPADLSFENTYRMGSPIEKDGLWLLAYTSREPNKPAHEIAEMARYFGIRLKIE